MQAELAASVASGFRSRERAKQDYRDWLEARDTRLTLIGTPGTGRPDVPNVLSGTAGGEPARVVLQQEPNEEGGNEDDENPTLFGAEERTRKRVGPVLAVAA